VRLFNKLIDEYVHNSCTVLAFATAFRPALLKLSPEAREAGFAKSPSKQRSEYKRDVVAHGLDSRFAKDAVEHHDKLPTWIEDAVKGGPYLAGEAYSLADIAVIPTRAAAGVASASRGMGRASRRHGVVGKSPPPAVDGGGDLQAHDRSALGTV
jgi:glutathione S-transferase